MSYCAIATDYDGTLATDGGVDEATWGAIAAYRQQGGKVVLVTGRAFDDLQQVCSPLERFDAVVAENGAVLYWPASRQVVLQGEPPPESLVLRLQQAGVTPLHQGQVILATWHPHGQLVQAAIAALQLPYQVILNKRAVMVLPAGVNKASGLQAVLQTLQISPAAVVGVGDAENDQDLLLACGGRVAVANALPSLKAIAHQVIPQARGAGVQALIRQLLTGEGGLRVEGCLHPGG